MARNPIVVAALLCTEFLALKEIPRSPSTPARSAVLLGFKDSLQFLDFFFLAPFNTVFSKISAHTCAWNYLLRSSPSSILPK